MEIDIGMEEAKEVSSEMKKVKSQRGTGLLQRSSSSQPLYRAFFYYAAAEFVAKLLSQKTYIQLTIHTPSSRVGGEIIGFSETEPKWPVMSLSLDSLLSLMSLFPVLYYK